MTKLFGGTIHSALIHAATQYDVKESRKKYHNIYALPQYFARIAEVEADIEQGATIRAALLAAFDGRLLNTLLRAVGEHKQTSEEKFGFKITYERVSK